MNTPPDPSFDGREEATTANPLADGFRSLSNRFPFVPVLAVVLVMVGLALLALSLRSKDDRPLYPPLPSFTPLAGTVSYEPILLGFAELNEDPSAYRGQRIQVSGAYTSVAAPECLDYTGPTIRWSLVADELQLNAVGFENLLRLIAEGTEMTVTGIWNAYHGPVGCGKEPTDGTVWYLAVDRILEPNPLFSGAGPALTVIAGEALPTLSPFETIEILTPTATSTLSVTELITPTGTVQSLLPTPITPTLVTTGLPVTPLITPVTPPGITGTPPLGGTPVATPTIDLSVTPGATIGAQQTPTLGFPTNTPTGPGYPGPGSPTPTTTGGYP